MRVEITIISKRASSTSTEPKKTFFPSSTQNFSPETDMSNRLNKELE